MPEKDGAEEKSTKSVVNKKQKQMMGEEGYDIARDMGRVRPSKDKKDATTMPPSKEMKKTQKVNKGPSAFERVKAKYGKSVMNVGKKKVKEELDLTKVAEAFGGYVICENPTNPIGTQKAADETPEEIKKRLAKQAAQERLARKGISDKPKRVINKMAKNIAKQEIEATGDKFVGGANLKNLNRKRKKVLPTDPGQLGKAGEVKVIKPAKTKAEKEAELEGKRKDYLDPKTNKASPEGIKKYITKARQMRSGSNVPVDQETTDNIAKIAGKEYADKINQKYGGRRAGRRQSTATPPAFATRTGESGGPLPVSMRNRRVPKTSSLSTPVTTTPTFKSFQDRVKTVTPEVVGGETKKSAQLTKTPKEGPVIDTTASQVFDNVKGGVTKGLLPPPQRQKQQEPQSQGTKQLPPSSTPNPYDLLNFPEFEKKRKTTTAGIDKTKQFKAPPIPKKSLQRTPPPTETETETQTETGGGTGGTGGGRKIKKRFGPDDNKPFTPIKSAREFARKDPVAALGAYDLGKGVLGKIMKTRLPSLQARSGFRSAKGGGGL